MNNEIKGLENVEIYSTILHEDKAGEVLTILCPVSSYPEIIKFAVMYNLPHERFNNNGQTGINLYR